MPSLSPPPNTSRVLPMGAWTALSSSSSEKWRWPAVSMVMMECPALGTESWGSVTSAQLLVSESGNSRTQTDGGHFDLQSKMRFCHIFHWDVVNWKLFLTDIKDESVTESIVPIVATVDQELCIREHSAAVPAGAHKCKLSQTVAQSTCKHLEMPQQIVQNESNRFLLCL